MLVVAVFFVLAVCTPFSQGKDFKEKGNDIRVFCEDVLAYCQHVCDSPVYSKEFLWKYCRETCGLCGCMDTVDYCYSIRGYCNSNDEFWVAFMPQYCPATCGFCQGCFDRIDCTAYTDVCCNQNYAVVMEYYCPATCGFCPGGILIDQVGVECGTKVQGTRIVGGTNSQPGTWPWQITMVYKGDAEPWHLCGGSIVAPQWILSAAHCFSEYGDDPTQYSIVAGEYDLDGVEGYEQNIPIEKIIKHPRYNDHTWDYDLALIELQYPLRYNNRVRPVCLPEFDFDVGTNCYVTGWGHTQEEGGDVSQILQQAQVPLISRDSCQAAFQDLGYTISPRMRCAGYAEGGIDACQGDSGGPLVCVRNDKWYLMGAVSWGEGCAREGLYGVYADMLDLKCWVQLTIDQNEMIILQQLG